MKYRCGIIKDLMPLYIDGVCGEESIRAVEEHLAECGQCRKYCDTMRNADGFAENVDSDCVEMADSLKKIKLRLNRKRAMAVICAVSGVLAVTAALWVLFNVPIKKIDKAAVKITAEVYPISELPYGVSVDDNSMTVSFDEGDSDSIYRVEIPSTGAAESENTGKSDEYATVITTTSDYFLRNMNWEIKDGTIHILGYRTTVLNNKAENYQKTMTSVEIGVIDKIVYDEPDGSQTVLWER